MKIFRSFTAGSLLILSLVVFIFFSTSSCKVERITMLKDIPDTTTLRYVPLSSYTAPVIRPDDILNIIIQVLDPQYNTLLNQGNLNMISGAVTGGSTSQQQAVVSGYLVSKDGYVYMPYIGKVY